jgi:hypothetical protein
MKTMNKFAQSLVPALLLASSSLLLAQEGEPLKAYVSFGQNFAQNHALSLTDKTWGGIGNYHAEFGLEFYHPASTLLVRPNAGYTRMLSKPDPSTWYRDEDGDLVENQQRTVFDMTAVFVGFDLVYNVSEKLPITATMGPIVHFWTVKQSNNVTSEDVFFKRDRFTDSSPKLGWRAGLGYNLKIRDYEVRMDLTYTLSEWRSTNKEGWRQGINPSHPSYFTIKASYTF